MGEGKGGEGPRRGAGKSSGDGYKGGGIKKNRNKNRSVKKEGKKKPMGRRGGVGVGGAAPALQEALGGTCSVLGRGVAASLRGRSIPPSRRLQIFEFYFIF